MNKQYLHILPLLQEKCNVGLVQGLELLEQTQGDVDKAALLFRKYLINTVVEKAGVTSELAERHLYENDFEIKATLNSIIEEPLSFTKRVLRKIKPVDSAVFEICEVITTKEKFELKITVPPEHWGKWYALEDFHYLEPHVYCFTTIATWLRVEYYETIEGAIEYYADIIVDQLYLLGLPDIAETFAALKEAEEADKPSRALAFAMRTSWGPSPLCRELSETFRKQKKIIFEALLEFVKKNVDRFP